MHTCKIRSEYFVNVCSETLLIWPPTISGLINKVVLLPRDNNSKERNPIEVAIYATGLINKSTARQVIAKIELHITWQSDDTL